MMRYIGTKLSEEHQHQRARTSGLQSKSDDFILFILYLPSSGIAPCVGTTWKWYRHLPSPALRIYRKGIAAPDALQFELRQSVSTSRLSIYHTQAGFDPPFAEGAEFTECKTDAFTNQTTTAGLKSDVLYIQNFCFSSSLSISSYFT